MEIAPLTTQVGDMIYLLPGSDVPFVLRPEDKNFRLIGQCYVHGVMYGEAINKGPLEDITLQ